MTTEEHTIDIEGIEHTALLKAFYSHAQPVGMGWLHARPGNLPDNEAAEVINGRTEWYVDYLLGRPLKIKVEGNTLNPRLWDRDYGPGSAQRIVDGLR